MGQEETAEVTRVSRGGTIQARAGLDTTALEKVVTEQACSWNFGGQRSWVGCQLGRDTFHPQMLVSWVLCVRALEGLAQSLHTLLSS